MNHVIKTLWGVLNFQLFSRAELLWSLWTLFKIIDYFICILSFAQEDEDKKSTIGEDSNKEDSGDEKGSENDSGSESDDKKKKKKKKVGLFVLMILRKGFVLLD